jgi:hypothetical protein
MSKSGCDVYTKNELGLPDALQLVSSHPFLGPKASTAVYEPDIRNRKQNR